MTLKWFICVLEHFCEVREPSEHAGNIYFVQWDLLTLLCGFLRSVQTCYGTAQKGARRGGSWCHFLVVGACHSSFDAG